MSMRALLLCLLALALLLPFGASAQVAPVCAAGKVPRCDQGEAYTDAARTASLGYCGAGKSPTATNVVHDALNHAYRGDYKCQGDTSWRSGYTSFYTALCTARPSWTSGYQPPNGSMTCNNGCYVEHYSNGDGTSTASPMGETCTNEDAPNDCSLVPGSYWHPTLNACVPIKPKDCLPGQEGQEGVCNKPEECPNGMITDANGLCKPKDNECPAGEIKSPEGSCLPGDGQCAAGEARGKDGTCKPDGNGDGTPDEEDDDPTNDPDPEGKGSFSGGDDCNSPPSCSGDPIMCGQARIQWRIECNTRRNNNITGGGCDQVPICTGEKCNAMEYAQLLQQWRTSCAVQKLAGTVGEGGINVVGGGGGGGGGDGNGNGVPDDAEQEVPEGEGPEPSVGEVDGGELWSKVDQAGWLGGGACPGLQPFQFMGKTYDLGSKPCEQVGLLGQLIVLAAMAGAAYIIGRAAAGG